MTRRLAIRDAVVAALNAGRPADVPEASTRRFVPGNPLDCARLAVFMAEEPVEGVGGPRGPIVRRQLSMAVQALAVSEEPDDLDDLVEPMLAWAVRALAAATFGGLAHEVVEQRTTWETARVGDRYAVAATLYLAVPYQSARADLTRAH